MVAGIGHVKKVDLTDPESVDVSSLPNEVLGKVGSALGGLGITPAELVATVQLDPTSANSGEVFVADGLGGGTYQLPASSGHTIQDEGTSLTQRTNLNFVGPGVEVTDDAGNDATVVTINVGDYVRIGSTETYTTVRDALLANKTRLFVVENVTEFSSISVADGTHFEVLINAGSTWEISSNATISSPSAQFGMTVRGLGSNPFNREASPALGFSSFLFNRTSGTNPLFTNAGSDPGDAIIKLENLIFNAVGTNACSVSSNISPIGSLYLRDVKYYAPTDGNTFYVGNTLGNKIICEYHNLEIVGSGDTTHSPITFLGSVGNFRGENLVLSGIWFQGSTIFGPSSTMTGYASLGPGVKIGSCKNLFMNINSQVVNILFSGIPADGDTISIDNNATSVTYEFDTSGNLPSGSLGDDIDASSSNYVVDISSVPDIEGILYEFSEAVTASGQTNIEVRNDYIYCSTAVSGLQPTVTTSSPTTIIIINEGLSIVGDRLENVYQHADQVTRNLYYLIEVHNVDDQYSHIFLNGQKAHVFNSKLNISCADTTKIKTGTIFNNVHCTKTPIIDPGIASYGITFSNCRFDLGLIVKNINNSRISGTFFDPETPGSTHTLTLGVSTSGVFATGLVDAPVVDDGTNNSTDFLEI